MSRIVIIDENIDEKNNMKTFFVKGEKGETGDTGPANTLEIGTVTKGENASATITGDSPNQTLNLVLPKGDKGDTGEKGETGDVNASQVFYQDNDIFAPGNNDIFFGYKFSSTAIKIKFPTPKLLDNINTIIIMFLNLWIHNLDGSDVNIDFSNFVDNIIILPEKNGIVVELVNNSGWSSINDVFLASANTSNGIVFKFNTAQA